MTTTLDAKEFQTELRRLDALLQEANRLTDPAAQAVARSLTQAVLALHAAGLECILAHLSEGGDAGRRVYDACVQDEVVSGLLLLHGLHPVGLEERVREALEQVRPALASHGGAVELVGLEDGVVRLRLVGSCDGCPSSAVTMRQTIEEAIYGKAPDVTAVEVENRTERPTAENGHARLALPLVGA